MLFSMQKCFTGTAWQNAGVRTYTKALAYCPGISGDTRRNVERIYEFNKDFVKTECLGEGWITSGSARVVRMAFNLFCNGTPSAYDLEGEEKVRECQRYTVEDVFCFTLKNGYLF